MTDTITVDLDRARELLREVCEAKPENVDDSTKYFDPNNGECLCVVGAIIEKLGKGYEDMHLNPESVSTQWAELNKRDLNSFDFTAILVDGVEFSEEAVVYLDEARSKNDAGIVWAEIPASVDRFAREYLGILS